MNIPRIDFTKPIQTRSGLPVRLLCTDAKGGFPVVALVSFTEGDFPESYTADGFLEHAGCINVRDLINVPPAAREVKLWLVLNEFGIHTRATAPAPEDLKGYRACKNISTTIVEGEGL